MSSSIPTNELAQRYPHLSELSFPSLKEGKVDLLLVCDLHRAFRVSDVLVGDLGLRCGLHTAIGWTIYGTDCGNQEEGSSPSLMVNFMNAQRETDHSCEQLLYMFAQDFEDIGEGEGDTSLSLEDKRALHILNNTVKRESGHYSVGLLWKEDSREMSDGRALAEKRLEGLKRRFKKNPDLYEKYCNKMKEYITNFAEPVSSESNGHCRYIPHHCTAAESKFRVVFDCSARSEDGKSLNDMLLRGPDLTNTVVGVLMRFRQHPVAVVADMKGMFSQVLVEENDREALRFLWYPDGYYNQPPATCRMRTHVFGAKSSPCCAAFALRMNGVENATSACEGAVNAVMKSVYVDDVCLSCVSEQEAIDLGGYYRMLAKRFASTQTAR